MINFRFHIISIVAVFLALGIGIVMGSTVIDRAIVDGLRSRIDIAEDNSVKRKAENERLEEQAKQLNQQDTVLASHSVRNYLENQSFYIFDIGNIPTDISTELVELGSVSGAQVSSMFTFTDAFVTNDRTKLFNEIMTIAKVDPTKIAAADRSQTFLSYFENALNVVRDKNEDVLKTDVDYASFLSALDSKSVYGESNTFQSPALNRPVSFIVLIEQSKLKDDKYVAFASHLVNNFPVTFGLVGNDIDTKPSRSEAVDKLKNAIPNLTLVDNAESPSGRAALLIAHSKNIAGIKDIYGISSSAKSKAPFISE